jgi:hypothetical protein
MLQKTSFDIICLGKYFFYVFKVQNINKNTEKEEFIKLGINWSLTHT